MMARTRIDIVFEDEAIVVIDKPAGLLTIATETERTRTAYAELRERASAKRGSRRERIFIVHRLDREASGLLVFAKTPAAKEKLQDQFKDHSARRTYVAVVEGRVRPEQFTIRSYLAENAMHRVYSTRKSGEGKLAVTHVRVLKSSPKSSLLEVRLETGRKHQIRVHLSERGHPILGDRTYGRSAGRLALHGVQLEFRHPVSGLPLQFKSGLPAAIAALGASAGANS